MKKAAGAAMIINAVVFAKDVFNTVLILFTFMELTCIGTPSEKQGG